MDIFNVVVVRLLAERHVMVGNDFVLKASSLPFCSVLRLKRLIKRIWQTVYDSPTICLKRLSSSSIPGDIVAPCSRFSHVVIPLAIVIDLP